jgi:VWFA-related protein
MSFRTDSRTRAPQQRLCLWLVCLFCVLLSVVAFSQNNADGDKNTTASAASQPSQQPKFSAEVKVVNVLATVRDKRGQIISNLSKDDFSLDEDGHPQTIKYFVRDTDLPLKLGLLVDTSQSVSKVLPDERKASESFLDQVLREGTDAAFVIHFDHQVELLQDVTSSRQKLASATEQIEPSPRNSDNSGGGNPRGGGYPGGGGGGYPGGGGGGYPGGRGGRGHGGGGTLLYDAIFLASDELMQKQQGRKALILLTDGEDRGSKTSLDSAIESAQKADTLVYCIYFKGEEGGGFSPYGQGHGGWNRGGMGRGGPGRFPQESHEDGKKVLQRIAKETGARMFEISKKQPIDQIYAEIQEELRNQYNIGYSPDRNASTAGYHKIRLIAKQKDAIVQTRDGYYE